MSICPICEGGGVIVVTIRDEFDHLRNQITRCRTCRGTGETA